MNVETMKKYAKHLEQRKKKIQAYETLRKRQLAVESPTQGADIDPRDIIYGRTIREEKDVNTAKRDFTHYHQRKARLIEEYERTHDRGHGAETDFEAVLRRLYETHISYWPISKLRARTLTEKDIETIEERVEEVREKGLPKYPGEGREGYEQAYEISLALHKAKQEPYDITTLEPVDPRDIIYGKTVREQLGTCPYLHYLAKKARLTEEYERGKDRIEGSVARTLDSDLDILKKSWSMRGGRDAENVKIVKKIVEKFYDRTMTEKEFSTLESYLEHFSSSHWSWKRSLGMTEQVIDPRDIIYGKKVREELDAARTVREHMYGDKEA